MNKSIMVYLVSYALIILGNSATFVAVYWIIGEKSTYSTLALVVSIVFFIRFLTSRIITNKIDLFHHVKLYSHLFITRIVILIVVLFSLKFVDYVWTVCLLTIVLNCLDVVSGSITPKFIKSFGEAHIVKLNSYISIVEKVLYVLGMTIGSFLIARTEINVILYIELVMYAVSLVLILSISKDLFYNFEKIAQEEESDSYDTSIVNYILIIAIAANIMITPYTALIIPYIREKISANPDIFTATEVFMMIGGVLTGILISKYLTLDSYQSDRLFVLSAVAQGILVILLSFNSNLVVYFIVMTLLGVCITTFNIPFSIILQSKVPIKAIGKAKSHIISISTIFSAISYVLSSFLVKYVDIAHIYIIFPVLGIMTLVVYKFRGRIKIGT
ncbi:hypothetical protein [Staphylococcus cornubiensis]|uniref:hypothetical protein n=1 Tax=Staphylococcus cornubiensis TaxID=1986155 RepID=UPI001F0A43E1|nr:hypothetical protein [Staphylococcus cornubiensis]